MISPTLVAFLLTLILPPAIFVALSASSMTIGLLLMATLWCFVGLVTGSPRFTLRWLDAERLSLVVVGALILLLHLTLNALQLGGVDYGRFFTSCVILLVVFTGAHFAADKLMAASDRLLLRMSGAAFIILTLTAIAGIAGVPTIGPQSSVKALVFFSEPSHFGLSFLPVLLIQTAVSRRPKQFVLMSAAFVLAAVLQSVTMMAGIFIVSAMVLRRLPLLLMILIVAGAALTLDLTYYSERLALSSESDNLTALVFLQGWDTALMNFKETHGVGVGFQQFGVSGSTSEIAERIAALLGGYINLLDGGSIAAKMIGEFGVLGVLTILVYVLVALRSALFIRREQFRPVGARDVRTIFFRALLVSYIFELFIRGVGYFSPGGFLALTALIALHRLRMQAPQTSPTAAPVAVAPE